MRRSPGVREVADYLRAQGWSRTGHWRGGAVWTLREFDVLVPPGDDLLDVPLRLHELLLCVAEAEGRSPQAVTRDIARPAVDVVSYRMPEAATGIALSAGVQAVGAVRDWWRPVPAKSWAPQPPPRCWSARCWSCPRSHSVSMSCCPRRKTPPLAAEPPCGSCTARRRYCTPCTAGRNAGCRRRGAVRAHRSGRTGPENAIPARLPLVPAGAHERGCGDG